MRDFYNNTVFLLYLGGIFSLLLTVAIIFVKQIQKREIERKRLEQVKQYRPEEVGDIDAKLNDSFDFRFPSFLQEITVWGIQPLFIISFVNLFSIAGEIELIITFSLVILTLFHEFYLSEKFSYNGWYQSLIILIWLVSFFIISFRMNIKEQQSRKDTGKHAILNQHLNLRRFGNFRAG